MTQACLQALLVSCAVRGKQHGNAYHTYQQSYQREEPRSVRRSFKGSCRVLQLFYFAHILDLSDGFTMALVLVLEAKKVHYDGVAQEVKDLKACSGHL